MNRKERLNFVREKIAPLVPVTGDSFRDMNILETERLVARFRIGKPVGMEMEPKVEGGFLFINGLPVGRIAANPHMKCGVVGDYFERKIMERQEELEIAEEM